MNLFVPWYKYFATPCTIGKVFRVNINTVSLSGSIMEGGEVYKERQHRLSREYVKVQH